MESWKEELYHYGIKGMKWGKRKAQRAADAESAARLIERAVRSEQEERESKNSKLSTKYASKAGNASARAYVTKEHNWGDPTPHEKAAEYYKQKANEYGQSHTYASNRAYSIKGNNKNRLAIATYNKKVTSKASKAKQAIKSLFSKNNKGGKAVTTYHRRTDKYADNYPPLDPEESGRQYKSTQYQPKKKRKK